MHLFPSKSLTPPNKGTLLISEPFLPDPNFERTVVLLCEHNEEGSFGFILNRPSMFTLDEILDEDVAAQPTVYVGGPVEQDTMHFIHKISDLEGCQAIGNDLYWGGNFDQMMSKIEDGLINEGDFRLFLGYSGWSAGQLEAELEEVSWIVRPAATADDIFQLDSSLLWKSVLDNMGGEYKLYANYPSDPRLN